MTSWSRGVQVLQGNVNTYSAELRELDPPIIARRIRFVPFSIHPKPACMRVELYGCTWTGKIFSFQPSRDGSKGKLRGFNPLELMM